MQNRIFIDFDDTLVQSSKAYCKTYNDLFQNNPDFTPADYTKNDDWNFSEVAPLAKHHTEILFGQSLFFDNLEFFPNAKEILEELNKKYDVYIVTIGTLENLTLKAKFIKRQLPFIKNVILLSNNGCKMDKSVVNMASKDNETINIFLDDNQSNLFSQEGTHNLVRYCFGVQKNWNAQWKKIGGRWLNDWNEVREKLL